jgi:hypothetical protein
MIQIEDIITIEEGPFSIWVDTQRSLDWEEFRDLVQSLAKIGTIHKPKEDEPEPTDPERIIA